MHLNAVLGFTNFLLHLYDSEQPAAVLVGCAIAAIAGDQLFLEYQPQVLADGSRMIGVGTPLTASYCLRAPAI